MTRVDLKDAQGRLKALLDKAGAGEEVFIVDGERTFRVSPAPVAANDASALLRPGRGSFSGGIETPDTFFDPWSPKDFGPGVMDNEPDWGEPGTWDGRMPRAPGQLRGVITLDDSFFDPLSDEDMGLADHDGR